MISDSLVSSRRFDLICMTFLTDSMKTCSIWNIKIEDVHLNFAVSLNRFESRCIHLHSSGHSLWPSAADVTKHSVNTPFIGNYINIYAAIIICNNLSSLAAYKNKKSCSGAYFLSSAFSSDANGKTLKKHECEPHWTRYVTFSIPHCYVNCI